MWKVKSAEGPHSDLVRSVSDRGKSQVRVSLEQTGTEVNADGYFVLRLEKVAPDYTRLTVSVEDLNSREMASKEVLFRYKK